MQIFWKKCPLRPGRTRNYPTNLGTFYQGSGFSNEEVTLINLAFSRITDAEERAFMRQERLL